MTATAVDPLAPTRTPARPGPGPLSSASLRALELSVGRRVDGLLAGDYRSAFAGIGSELWQVRAYEPGDDVRRMEWNVTARTGQPHVRVELAERVLVTWLVLDASASMAFGTGDRRKADIAEGVAIAVGYAATRRGNRLGTIAFGMEAVVERPRQGRRALLETLRLLRELPAGGNGSLRSALELADRVATQRSLVIVVSDFRGPLDWRPPLLRLAGRHTVLAAEIRDPREQELADVGELRLVDPESGRQLRVDTGDPSCGAASPRRPPPSARPCSRASPPQALVMSHCRRTATGSVRWRHFSAAESGCDELPAPERARLAADGPARRGRVHLVRAQARPAGRRVGAARAAREHGRSPLGVAAPSPDGAPPAGRRAPPRGFRAPAGEGSRQARGRDRRARRRRVRLDGRPDSKPTRLGAARKVADEYLDKLPKGYRVAVITFSDHTTLVTPPTHNTALARAALDRAQSGPQGTALADAVARAVRVAKTVPRTPGARRPPAVIVILSDGGQTAGRVTPEQATQFAHGAGIPVTAIALGTPDGVVNQQLKGGFTERIQVPVQPAVMQGIARGSGGRFVAGVAAVDPATTFDELGSRVGHTHKTIEVTSAAAAGGLAFLLAGAFVSGIWFRRLV